MDMGPFSAPSKLTTESEYENKHDSLISSGNMSDKAFWIVKAIVVISYVKIIVQFNKGHI